MRDNKFRENQHKEGHGFRKGVKNHALPSHCLIYLAFDWRDLYILPLSIFEFRDSRRTEFSIFIMVIKRITFALVP